MNTSLSENFDNTSLITLINTYAGEQTEESYAAVINELMHGHACLLLPTANTKKPQQQWRNMDEGESLDLTSVFNVDGLNVLGAFTSEETLLEWAQKETHYSAMPAREVIDLCMANSIQRIVIDSDQPTMFVLQRNTDHVETETVQKSTDVLVGTPSNPIKGKLLERLQECLSNVSVVQEAYQFAMNRGRETSLVLAFKLDKYNNNTRKACQYAVEDALQDKTMEQGLDLFYLKDESWYETARGVENSLVYKR